MRIQERTTKCPKCNGSGRVRLDCAFTEEVFRTLAVFPPKRGILVTEVHKALQEDVTINAINTRLRSMHRAGLLKRTRKGRFFYYARAA